MPAGAAVVGVYPSALHVRWQPPAWAPNTRATILAVDDEPTVFWDGCDAAERVEAWKAAVGFRDGDGPDGWGRVNPAGNGTSGVPVRDVILARLGVTPEQTWFTDVVNQYFVKDGDASQRSALRDIYEPFAARAGHLKPAALPSRPAPGALVTLAVAEHGARLRRELTKAAPPVVVSLGEEARQVLARIADRSSGPPTVPLANPASLEDTYGRPGTLTIGGLQLRWYAAVHPGNRTSAWRTLHERRFATH